MTGLQRPDSFTELDACPSVDKGRHGFVSGPQHPVNDHDDPASGDPSRKRDDTRRRCQDSLTRGAGQIDASVAGRIRSRRRRKLRVTVVGRSGACQPAAAAAEARVPKAPVRAPSAKATRIKKTRTR